MKETPTPKKQFGAGAIKNSLDLRDRKWSKLASASTPFDWDEGYDIEKELKSFLDNPKFKIPVKNQGKSSSCVGQAGAYYESVQDTFEKGVFVERSAKDAYSQIFYPQGGAMLRDLFDLLIKKGVTKESLISSYQNGKSPSEEFMREKKQTPETITDALTALGSGYAVVGKTIDSFAQAMRDNRGLIFVIDGENNGTWHSKFPKIPENIEWSHALYAGKAKKIDGKKYIGVLNSWDNVGDKGWQWIGEEHFKYITDGTVLYDTTLYTEKLTLLKKALELAQKLLNILRKN